MPERHHWQCNWNLDQYDFECDCGVSGPRAWWMDHLPHDRAPTEAEAEAWRHAIRAREERQPVRIQRRRAKGWRLPEGALCVDRSTAWGNPFIVGRDGTRAECVELYCKLMAGYVCLTCSAESDEQIRARDHALNTLAELRGRDLACWCPLPKPGERDVCHAAVLLVLANTKREPETQRCLT